MCVACEREVDRDFRGFRCSCGGPLDVQLQLSLARGSFSSDDGSLWRYRDAIPIDDQSAIVSLGEGMTSLLEAELDGARPSLESRIPRADGILQRSRRVRAAEPLKGNGGRGDSRG